DAAARAHRDGQRHLLGGDLPRGRLARPRTSRPRRRARRGGLLLGTLDAVARHAGPLGGGGKRRRHRQGLRLRLFRVRSRLRPGAALARPAARPWADALGAADNRPVASPRHPFGAQPHCPAHAGSGAGLSAVNHGASMTQLCDIDAVTLRRMIGAKEISPVALLESCLDRIAAANPALNAVTATCVERARAEAKAAEQAVLRGDPLGVLHGLPIGIKDLDETEGLRTTWGSPIYADHVPAKDERMVAAVRAAGAIVV